jgi:hypothetical protein
MGLRPLDKLTEEYYTKYDSIGRIWCKILNSDVHFTAEGRLHLLYKANRKKRNVVEQRFKLSLFPLVIPVLKYSKDIQNWRFPKSDDPEDVQYYAVVGTAGHSKIQVRVIVKRTGDGQFNFHSVMIHNNRTKKPRRKRRG